MPKAWVEGGRVTFRCPGCGVLHGPLNVDPKQGSAWSFNFDWANPTLSPSVLIRAGHYASGHDGESCWCTYNAENPDKPASFKCFRCHSFVQDGKIQFLNDCTHALAGKTVDLPEVYEGAELELHKARQNGNT